MGNTAQTLQMSACTVLGGNHFQYYELLNSDSRVGLRLAIKKNSMEMEIILQQDMFLPATGSTEKCFHAHV